MNFGAMATKFPLHALTIDFTQRGRLAPDDLKRKEDKLQRMVQVMRPLQMASLGFSGALR